MILELKNGSRVFTGNVPQSKLDILYDITQRTLDHDFVLSEEETLGVVSWLDAHVPDHAISAYVDEVASLEADFLGGTIRSSDVYWDTLAGINVTFIETQLYRPDWVDREQEDMQLSNIDQQYGNVSL